MDIKKTFGEDKCGQVLTKTPFSPKMLIKDLSARQGIDFQEVNLVTKQLDSDEDYHENQKVMDFLYDHPEVENFIDPLTGITKSLGVHAGALIVFDDIMDKYVSTVSVTGSPIISNNVDTSREMSVEIDVKAHQREGYAFVDRPTANVFGAFTKSLALFSSINVKSVSVGIRARPPPQEPKIAVICGITPEAIVFLSKIPEYPLNESIPSSIRAPPLSLIVTIGHFILIAIS